jgi:hypothetical protein
MRNFHYSASRFGMQLAFLTFDAKLAGSGAILPKSSQKQAKTT